MFQFIPDKNDKYKSGIVDVPYLEDARADYAPYYTSDKTEPQARSEVIQELAKLGGASVQFQTGIFMFGEQKRYGYNIHFQYIGAPALLRVAGLPIKSETENKIRQVKVQALLNVRDWLKAAVTNPIFSPGSQVLVDKILVDPQRGITVGDVMARLADSGDLPRKMLNAGTNFGEENSETIDGNFKDR